MPKDELEYTKDEVAALNEPIPMEEDILVDEPDEEDVDPDIIAGDDDEDEDPEAEDEDEGEEEEDDEPRTYSQKEYDKVVRQRDAIAHEKQTAGREHRESQARVDERLSAIMEAIGDKDDDEEEVDLTDMNTAERIEHQNAEILKRLDGLESRGTASDDEAAARSATKQIQGFAVASQEEYLEESGLDKKTFEAQLNAVRADLYEDYTDAGDDDATARGKVGQFEMNLITQASKSGKNPAEIMMKRFKRKRLVVPKVKGEVKKPESSVKKNLKRIKAGRRASSASSKRSGSTRMKLTAEALDEMDKEEFEAVMSKIKDTEKEDQLDTHGYTYINA